MERRTGSVGSIPDWLGLLSIICISPLPPSCMLSASKECFCMSCLVTSQLCSEDCFLYESPSEEGTFLRF